MKYGVLLLKVNPGLWADVAVEAEALGYESVWMAEHVVLPATFGDSRYPAAEKPPISPMTPTFDVISYLSYLAGLTTQLRFGTFVYELALRHPFVGARAATTLDIVSGGRFDFGIGAGWMASEWEACGVDFATRGRRLDECIEVCQRLWTEPIVEHEGEFFQFPPVAFEPKPLQRPSPPLHVGGESPAAYRRALRYGDGWIGMFHNPGSAKVLVDALRIMEKEFDRPPLETTVAAEPGALDDLEAWEASGIDRLVVAPWERSSEAISGMKALAGRLGLPDGSK